MGLLLTTVAGLIVWIVLWSLGQKAFDAFLITLALVVVAAALRAVTPHLPGNRREQLPPPGA